MKPKAPVQAVEELESLDLEVALSKAGLDGMGLALSKARAARILLAATADYLEIPIPLDPADSEEEVRGWIHDFAFEALGAALEEAEAARQKTQGRSHSGKRKGIA